MKLLCFVSVWIATCTGLSCKQFQTQTVVGENAAAFGDQAVGMNQPPQMKECQVGQDACFSLTYDLTIGMIDGLKDSAGRSPVGKNIQMKQSQGMCGTKGTCPLLVQTLEASFNDEATMENLIKSSANDEMPPVARRSLVEYANAAAQSQYRQLDASEKCSTLSATGKDRGIPADADVADAPDCAAGKAAGMCSEEAAAYYCAATCKIPCTDTKPESDEDIDMSEMMKSIDIANMDCKETSDLGSTSSFGARKNDDGCGKATEFGCDDDDDDMEDIAIGVGVGGAVVGLGLLGLVYYCCCYKSPSVPQQAPVQAGKVEQSVDFGGL